MRDNILKILAVEHIILEYQPITTNDIICKLHNIYEIDAERKSIYQNIASLGRFYNVLKFYDNENRQWKWQMTKI